MQVPEQWADSGTLCTVQICNATLVFDKDLRQAKFVESLLKPEIPNIDHRASCTVHLKFGAKPEAQPAPGPEEQLLGQQRGIPSRADCSSDDPPAGNASAWVTLFNDDDYARYIVEGQIPAPAGFVKGIWREFTQLLQKYQRHYKNLVMFAGPIYDVDNDGVRDSHAQVVEV